MTVTQRHEPALSVVQSVGELNQFQPPPPWAERSHSENHKRLYVRYFIGHIQGSSRIHRTGRTRGDFAVLASATIVVRKRKCACALQLLIFIAMPISSYMVAQQASKTASPSSQVRLRCSPRQLALQQGAQPCIPISDAPTDLLQPREDKSHVVEAPISVAVV